MAVTQPRDMNKALAEAFNAGDLAALLALYEPEARMVVSPEQMAAGHSAIAEEFKALLAMKGTLQSENVFCVQNGDIALLRAQWHFSGTSPDGEPVEMQGNSAEVVRRQPDGSWLYIIDHIIDHATGTD